MRSMHATAWLASAAIALLLVGASSAETIYVAPKDSDDYAAAQELGGAAVERSFHKGLTRAAELLNEPGARTVSVLVAQGEYDGKVGLGIWEVPTIKNREGALHLLGGYTNGFERRDPFGQLTELVTSPGRNGPFITLEKNSELAQVIISGFVMDAYPSNAYDRKTDSLLRDRSRTYPMLAFGYLKTNSLVIADNVFINGPHGVFDPLIVPLSPEATVDIQNNYFLNNIKPMQIGAGISPVKEVRLSGNTFLLNWPYNPDTTSSNVGAVSLHNSGSSDHLLIEGNLFTYNVGGALQHDWPEDRMPEVTIRDNWFYQNATLFGNDGADAGVVVGKFGTNPIYMVLDLETLEDDFDYTVEGNVAGDPLLEVNLGLTTSEDDDDVKLSGYAPRMRFEIPTPGDEDAQAYGAKSGSILEPGGEPNDE